MIAIYTIATGKESLSDGSGQHKNNPEINYNYEMRYLLN
jgi:hypothetical protein